MQVGKGGSIVIPLFNNTIDTVHILSHSSSNAKFTFAFAGSVIPPFGVVCDTIIYIPTISNVDTVRVQYTTSENTIYLEIFGRGAELLKVQGDEIVPDVFSLSQNYPNPFNPSTTVAYYLPTESEVTIKIFNILGQEIQILVSEKLKAGSHHNEWNAEQFPSGVYILRMVGDGFQESKKMILLK
ncbi:MAG: T9SS type A sorting domain-containing protein [Ignavibacteriales bacterium]|nr:T9SS type A sorting domain-containing protein [Ignavibacteriales bacterium]